MKENRRIRVSCPACEIDYRLRDATLLPIARCGRCYGAVVAEGRIHDAASDADGPTPARAA
jgi:Zn-finger nucleic acid-binding protein